MNCKAASITAYYIRLDRNFWHCAMTNFVFIWSHLQAVLEGC